MCKYCFVKLKQWWPWLGYFLIFSLSFIIFLYILAPPGIIGPDSFYHTKMALMIKEQGLVNNFPWLQFTTYKDLFVDHHFGYHYLLAAFLSLPTPQNLDIFSAEIDPLIKTKLATAFFAALVFVFMYWFLRSLKVKIPLFWALIGLLLAPFLIRLSFIRAPAISIIILILGFYLILNKKYLALFILSFIYVWMYGTWPLMLITVVLYGLARAIKSTIYHQPSTIINFFKQLFSLINLKLFASCILGLSAGLIINPYFPKTLPFYWFQTIKIALLNYQDKVNIGAEWYSYEPSALFLNLLPILILWIISLAWFTTKIKKQKTSHWFFMILSVFFLFFTFKSRRNVEYFIPPAIFFSALIFSQISQKINWPKLKQQFQYYFSGSQNIFYFMLTIFFILFAGFFLVFYLNFSIKNLQNAYQQKARPINHLQMASHWLKNNTEAEKIVFQSNWDIFPELFFFNTRNYYINGLDQTFMYEKNKDLYQTWSNLFFNKTDPHKTAQILAEKFKAAYILVDKKDKNFAKLIKKSTSLKKVYEDYEAIIYKNMFLVEQNS